MSPKNPWERRRRPMQKKAKKYTCLKCRRLFEIISTDQLCSGCSPHAKRKRREGLRKWRHKQDMPTEEKARRYLRRRHRKWELKRQDANTRRVLGLLDGDASPEAKPPGKSPRS